MHVYNLHDYKIYTNQIFYLKLIIDIQNFVYI